MSDTRPELADVTIVFVAYNSRHVLQSQLSLLAQASNVIVVDNASQDGTADWLMQAVPHAEVLRMPENVGFGRAHNFALACCETTFALLLNPDCRIEPLAVATLAESLIRHPDALLSVPALVYADGRAQENHRAFFHTRPRNRSSYRVPDGELCCEMVSGAVMMVRVKTFQQMGGFDPWFFLYWEDEELCIRARQQQLAVILEPQCVACHVAQTSSKPSLRGSFVRHYCYTTSKLYLRRSLGEGRAVLSFRALGTLLTGLLSLPINLLVGERHKAVRSAARIAAVMTAPWQLQRERCVSTPSQLWRSKRQH